MSMREPHTREILPPTPKPALLSAGLDDLMNANHAAVTICKNVLQCSLEASSGLPYVPTELGKDRLAALVVASNGASPRRVPRGVLVHVDGAPSYRARQSFPQSVIG